MKCKLCGKDLDEESEVDEKISDMTATYENELCWNCWYERTYGDNANTIAYDTKMKDINEINSSNIITTIEYLLICPECQHQTGYSYLWFAI
jgi:hypothetical protein